ncbi:nuclease-related domain-containing protein [Corallococcus sp. CA054B]|uniref:nuclease-related domain-containing protein n=1 Tax=Corallococcus sp. CA054B TaxID=2316734 RepID=UPI0013158AE7|nr:nuclease-related domain-containing protein [Corallococcus sp. CA054B]
MADESPFTTLVARVLGIPTAEQAWGRGADGEEHVGALLAKLVPHGWAVEHDVKIGRRGANVDHLVIGPPGVYLIETKLVSADVWVDGDVIKVGGFSKDYVDKLEADVLHVREKLLAVTKRRRLWVQGLLVFVRPTLKVVQQPQNVHVLADHELVPGLLDQEVRLEDAEVKQLVRAARQASTWK